MVTLSPEERERYRRQMQLPRFGEAAQLALKRTCVLITGVGGLGGTVALYLAAAGVGRLILVREGDLRRDDLNRQVLMTDDWVGRPRVWKAKDTLQAFNPHVVIEAIPAPLSDANRQALVARCDLAIDGAHNFGERAWLNQTCVEQGKPLVEAAMDGMMAYLTILVPGQTPCLHCLFPELPAWDCWGFGVLGAVAGTLACLTALETIKFITGLAPALVGELLVMHLGGLTFRKHRLHRHPACPVCGR